MTNIHYSVKFEDSKYIFHGEFELQASTFQIKKNIEIVKARAIQNLREKCESHFKKDFNKLNYFEMYLFENGEEVRLFEKVK